MYAALEKSGQLQKALEHAALATLYAMDDLEGRKGMDHQAAWEAIREDYLFLPSEEDLPVLGQNPAGLPTALWDSITTPRPERKRT